MADSPSLVEALQSLARPNTDEYFLLMALLASTKGTCGRRRVGCVLVDAHNHVISTGYNGVASGVAHCIDKGCPGRDLPSGTGLDKCEALHAEENALIQCTRPNDIQTVYSTTSPCVFCVRRLMNTGAKRIVFAELYPHPESQFLWTGQHPAKVDGQPQIFTINTTGRTWTHLPWDQLRCIANTRLAPSAPGPSSLKDRFLSTDTLLLREVQSPGSPTPSFSTRLGAGSNNKPS